MDLELISEEHYYLQKVSRYLNYQLSGSVLVFLTYAWVITLILAILAATIFAPYMLYAFYRSNKISWIIGFCAIVLLPMVICIILGLIVGYLTAFVLIPLGFFYFYCFVMKFIINDKIKEISAGEELRKKKEEEKNEQELWLMQFNKKHDS